MSNQVQLEKPPCPTCSGYQGANGRPRNKLRPEIRLTAAYVSKIGAQCGDMAEALQRVAGHMITDAEARELALISERLMQIKEMFQ